MKNKKGFVFLETIITVVVLTTTLVLLYASYSKSILSEKQKLYYDDIAYVYRTKVIRDILDESIDETLWHDALDKAMANKYLYVFNVESNIYYDNSLLYNAYNLFPFYSLVYVDLDNVLPLKKCLKDKNINCNSYTVASACTTDECKCCVSKKVISGYGQSNLANYLLTLDVPTNDGLVTSDYLISDQTKGIIVSLFYESKDGGVKVDDYENCLYEKIKGYYPSLEKKVAIKEYYNNDSLNYNMACQNAYYLSWVYL